MKSYKSSINGHLINCAPLPGDGKGEYGGRGYNDGHFVRLLKLPLQGSELSVERMSPIKTVEVNGVARVFHRDREGFEYYQGKQSLTAYLFTFRGTVNNVVKIY